MCDDRFEILDTDDNMKFLLNSEFAELKCIHGDCSMEWLLQYF